MIGQLLVGLLGACAIGLGLALLCVQPVPFGVAMAGGVVALAAGIGWMTWSVGAR